MSLRPVARIFVCSLLLVWMPQSLLAQQNKTLEERVSHLERLMDNPVLIEAIRRIDGLEEELRLLRGEAETNRHELDALRQRQREVYLDVDRRLQRIEEGETDSKPPSVSQQTDAPLASTAQATTPPQRDVDERQIYQQALDMLLQGRNTQAATAFTDFLKRYPESSYAANAQYWLGEARYVMRDFQAARVEFQKVLDQYSDSHKAPDARLKLGFTYYELEQWDNAQKTLHDVIRLYPDTTFSHLAKQRLQRIQRHRP